MDKRTLLAVVLSVVVISAGFMIQGIISPRTEPEVVQPIEQSIADTSDPVVESREDTDAQMATGVLHRTLHIGLVHPIPNQHSGSRMTADIVRRKEPGPHPVKLELWVFLGQALGQHQGRAVLLISFPYGSGNIDLLRHLGYQRLGQGHHPVFAALGAPDAEPGMREIHVLDPKVERFGNAQTATVE